MSPIYGSSRIQNVSGIYGETGPTGPTGAIGPKGITGDIGHTGSIGLAGIGIISGPTGASGGDGIRFFEENEHGGDIITFSLTDGTTLGVSGARGATGDTLENDYSIINTIESDGYGQVFKVKSGATAFFRNLTISGRDISIEEKDYTLLLKGRTYDYGVMGNTGELVYQYEGLSAHGALNTYWDNDNNNLLARILVHREREGSNNLLLSPTNKETSVASDTIIGSSVPFENLSPTDDDIPEFKGGTASVIGIHLGQTGNSDGSSADIIHIFPGVTFTSKISSSMIGSCCYCENRQESVFDSDRPNCVDYVTTEYCSNIGGIFAETTCLNRPEGPDCYVEGSCCINDICVQSSEDNCNRFGGFFIEDLTCEELELMGDEENPNGCPEPCATRGSCCINNVCYELTEYECSLQPNSTFIDQSCENTNCCLESNIGACCRDELCNETTAQACANVGGVFWGIGSACAGPYGAWEGNLNYTIPGVYGYPECILEDGTIGSGAECIGWTQVISDECEDNICACEEGNLVCPCSNATQDYGCNICGNNTESCGNIILVDGTCWECCCGSTDLPTTTPSPLGYCCEDEFSEGDDPFGDGCMYYDGNGDLKSNCLWRCFLGQIAGCGHDSNSGVPFGDYCGMHRVVVDYLTYRCSFEFLNYINATDGDYGLAFNNMMAAGDEYSTQCSGGFSIETLIYDFGPSGDPYGGPRFQWTMINGPYDDTAPGCAVGHTVGVDWHLDCLEAATANFPCFIPECEGISCPNSPDIDGNCCIPDDCCPIDVTTNPPFPDGGFPTTEPPRRVGPLAGGGNRSNNASCTLKTKIECESGGGSWYEDYSECVSNCDGGGLL